jgi:hypothetical protein
MGASILCGENTHFITIDLDVFSRRRLSGLVAALGETVFALYEGPWKSRYAAILELAIPSKMTTMTADGEIRRFISLINALPSDARNYWDTAQSRTFNIGIQAGMQPHAHILRISNKTIEEAARLGADVAITTYAAYVDNDKDNIIQKQQRPPNHRLELTAALRVIVRPRSSA